MKVLLDKCIPRKFKNCLPGHECQTVPIAGFAGRKNGELLRLAEAQGFEVFLTVDSGIPYEQNLEGRRIGIVILHGKSNRLADLVPCVEDCLLKLRSIQPGQVLHVGSG